MSIAAKTSMTDAMDAVLAPTRDPRVANALSRRRKRTNLVVKLLCVAATVAGLAFLASIIFTLLRLGLGGLSLSVLTHTTKPSGGGGGLLNPIVGSIIQTVIGAAIGKDAVDHQREHLEGLYAAARGGGEASGNFAEIKAVGFVLLLEFVDEHLAKLHIRDGARGFDN